MLVDRRMRRAKSDGIDADLLLRTLLAWLRGEPRVCSMVPVPEEADEDARRSVRERAELIAERISLTNSIGAILATLGTGEYNPLRRDRWQRLEELRTALNTPLPPHARSKIIRLISRLELVLEQIAQIDQERDDHFAERGSILCRDNRQLGVFYRCARDSNFGQKIVRWCIRGYRRSGRQWKHKQDQLHMLNSSSPLDRAT